MRKVDTSEAQKPHELFVELEKLRRRVEVLEAVADVLKRNGSIGCPSVAGLQDHPDCENHGDCADCWTAALEGKTP